MRKLVLFICLALISCGGVSERKAKSIALKTVQEREHWTDVSMSAKRMDDGWHVTVTPYNVVDGKRGPVGVDAERFVTINDQGQVTHYGTMLD
jgi:hypothetical protein